MPIIVDLKHCVEEARMHTAGSGTAGYYSSKKGSLTLILQSVYKQSLLQSQGA